MKNKQKIAAKTAVWALLGLIVGGATGVWAVGGSKLVLNGKTASNDVRVISGKAYAPLKDIAKAQGLIVVPISGGYEIKTAGGATPIRGLQGKVGDVLFDGKWRFQLLSIHKAGTYVLKNKSTTDYAVYNAIAELDDRTFLPREGRILLVVKCRLTNGRNANAALWTYNNDTRTAIADSSGESHPPIAYDLEESGPFQSKSLLPGAKTDFTVLFSIPNDKTPKDLVFTLRTIDNKDKGNDARVSLNP